MAPTQNNGAAAVAPATTPSHTTNVPPVYPTFAERATALVDRGFSVIPLAHREKKPVPGIGANAHTQNLQTIQAWANIWPDANAGVCADANVTILESDDAPRFRQILADMGIELPVTLTGGASENRPHWFYKRTPECGEDCITVPGLFEFRNRGQYVVGPGSIHPNGSQYRFWNDAPTVELSAAVIEALRQLADEYRGEGEGAGEHIQPGAYTILRRAYMQHLDPADLLKIEGLEIGEGARHYTLTSLAGLLHDGERSAEDITEILRDVRDAYFADGKGDQEIENAAAWAVRTAPVQLEPWDLPSFAIKTHTGGLKVFASAENMAKWISEHQYAIEVTEVLKFSKPAVPRKQLDFILAPTAGERFNGWFPRGRPHGIGASSGQGKTTFIVDILDKQSRGEIVFGHRGLGLPYLCIWADRGQLANEETLMRLGLDQAGIPVEYMDSALFDREAAQKVLELIERQPVMPAAVFIEGADFMTEDPYSTPKVASLMKDLQRIAAHYHIAMILSVGAPKMKPKEQYALKRDRIFGSQAWARTMDQVLILSQKHGAPPEDRQLDVLHRNAAEESFELTFKGGNGKLVPKASRSAGAKIGPVEMWVINHGKPFTRTEAVQAMKAADSGLGKSQVYDQVSRLLNTGALVEVTGPDGKIRLQRTAEVVETGL